MREVRAKTWLAVAFVSLVLTGCYGNQKFDNLYRASKAVKGAIAVGVTYGKFGELLQQLSTELLIAEDRVSTESEKKLVAAYRDTLVAYADSNSIWKQQIDGARYDFIPKGEVYVEGDVGPIAAKYSIPTNARKAIYSGRDFQTIEGQKAVQLIWQSAAEKSVTADQLYLGR